MSLPIPLSGYETLYSATPDGQIISHWGVHDKVLKQYVAKTTKGRKITRYNYQVSLTKRDGTKQKFLVHRLVALTYITKVQGKDQINHKDGNPLNNSVDNLEWCNSSENMQHAYAMGLKIAPRGESSGRSKITEKQAREILSLKGMFMEKEVAKMYPISKGMVGSIWRGNSWKHINS